MEKVKKEVCVAGKTIEVIVKVPSGRHTAGRKAKTNITREAVQKNNDRLAVIKLRRTLNANFQKGDLHIVLTYREAPETERAKKDRANFIKKLQRHCKKSGKELKYIAVTEYKHTRIHHHMVINMSDIEFLSDAWTHGLIKATPLDSSGQYGKLAEYLLKETQKTFREDGCPNKRRYSSSTNLIKPVVKSEYVNIEQLFDDPKAISGYYLTEENIRRYEHPVTHLEHLEYIMIALGEPRKYKVWPRGKVTSDKEYFKIEAEAYEEEQLIFAKCFNQKAR